MNRKALTRTAIVITLLLLWSFLSWYIARINYLARADELIRTETQLSKVRAQDLAVSIEQNLNYLSGVPGFFSNALRVRQSLALFGPQITTSSLPYELRKSRWTNEPTLQDLSQTLLIAKSELKTDLIYVVNAAGDCIAASNWIYPTSIIGTNFAERDMIKANRKGLPGMQYAVGKMTHIPGLFFSSPVIVNGQYSGSVVAKIDVPNLSFLVKQTDAFISDINGAIILSHDANKIMRAMPDSQATRISPDACDALYQRRSFSTLKLASWHDPDFPMLLRIQGENVPHLIASVTIAKYGLTVYVENDLPALTVLKRERIGYEIFSGILGGIVILAFTAGFFYIQSIRRSKRILQDSEARLQRLTQLYAALSQCNQAIVRCSSEAELFPQICRDAVTFGGMTMAWIGLLDEQQLKPIASYGDGLSYLEKLQVSAGRDNPASSGPIGIAIREDRPFWCQDFVHDPATLPWQKLGAQFGWRASASLPLHRDGVVIGAFTLYSSAINAFDEAGRNLLIEMATDIDFALKGYQIEMQRKTAEQEWRKLSQVVEQSHNAIYITDLNAKIEYVNQAAIRHTGYSAAELIGANTNLLQSDKVPRTVFHEILERLSRGQEWHGELTNARKDGSEYSVLTMISPIHQSNGHITHYVSIQDDITERKLAEQRLQHLVNYDALTGLPNRLQLEERVKFAISLAKRSSSTLALMFLDLDNFKDINDTLGHSFGDILLIELAKRLQLTLREEDTVSRLGGDEFILLLPDIDAHGAAQVAEKLLRNISRPYQSDHTELNMTASIGIALYPDDGQDLETLSKRADSAMYRVKQEGRHGFHFFTAEMQARSSRNLQLVNALRHAVELGQLALHYQPQISMNDGRVIGAEALLRWQHPEMGVVSPAEFIPVAEESRLILPIGEWVLRQATQQAKCWMEAGQAPLVISVNLSAVQFRHPDLPDLITRILNEVGLPPEYLELELTEGAAMHDPQAAIAIMNNLHDRGIRMSIDDFGTGYSSLSYLKKFQIYKLKIDQSFVRDISTDNEDKAIVSAVINMAKSLGLITIAEGVETGGQLAFLREQGCEEVQGYYYSKPLPAEQFAAFIQSGILMSS